MSVFGFETYRASADTAVGVAVNQGVYWRPDAQLYLSDTRYYLWLLRTSSMVVEDAVARKRHECANCHLPILPKMAYYNVFVGKGLAALKYPERIHLLCLGAYCKSKGLIK